MSVARKHVYTTGEAARICRLSQQTIIRCFDKGTLQGFRVPNSKFRRIPHDSLLQFMRQNNIPVQRLNQDKIVVLIVDDNAETAALTQQSLDNDGRFDTTVTNSGYNAGILTERLLPDVVVLDGMPDDINTATVCRTLRNNPRLAHIKVLLTSAIYDQVTIDQLMPGGANAFIPKPYNVDILRQKLLDLVNR